MAVGGYHRIHDYGAELVNSLVCASFSIQGGNFLLDGIRSARIYVVLVILAGLMDGCGTSKTVDAANHPGHPGIDISSDRLENIIVYPATGWIDRFVEYACENFWGYV